MAEVRASIAHLYSLGRFQDVQVDAVDAAERRRRAALQPRPGARRRSGGVSRQPRACPRGGCARPSTERFGRDPAAGTRRRKWRARSEQLYQDQRLLPRLDPPRFDRAAQSRANHPDLRHRRRTAGARRRHRGRRRARSATREALLSASGPRAWPALRAGTPERSGWPITQRRLKSRGYLQAAASHTGTDCRTTAGSPSLTLDIQSGPIVTVTFEGDPLPADRRSRAGAVRARRIGRRGSARGFGAAHPRLPAASRATGRPTSPCGRSRRTRQLDIVFFGPERPDLPGRAGRRADHRQQSMSIEEIRPLLVLAARAISTSPRTSTRRSGALVRLYRTRGFRWAERQVSARPKPAPTAAAALRPPGDRDRRRPARRARRGDDHRRHGAERGGGPPHCCSCRPGQPLLRAVDQRRRATPCSSSI